MRRAGRSATIAAASAAFAAALAMGAMLPGVAMADVGDGTGTIEMTTVEGNAGMVYDVYKIFTCDVSKSSDGSGAYVATDISFSNDAMWKTIVTAIDTYDNTFLTSDDYKDKSAQEVADYLESTITGGTAYRAEANGLVENITKAVVETTPTDTLTAGEAKSLYEGYYLIVSRPASQEGSTLSTASPAVGTSPIFVMLGEDQTLVVEEKTSVPTLTKTVAEGTSTTGGAACVDAQIGQDVTYLLTGTVSNNIVTFTSYAYTFQDVLPDGVELSCAGGSFEESDVTVNVVNEGAATQIPVTSYQAAYDSSTRTLTVSFAADDGTNDLLSAKDASGADVAINANSKVTVSYGATLTADAAVGSDGNTNTATLTYSNDPQNTGTIGTSAAATATVYTYQLLLYKTNADATTPLPGAKFSVQATTADDQGSADKYVKTDGSLGATTLPEATAEDYGDYIFETDTEGVIVVPGLDAGTYSIVELEAPEGCKTLTTSLTLKITPSFDNGAFSSMTATLSGGNGDANTMVISSDDGIVEIQVTNAATDGRLPLTGLPGITPVYVFGGAILAVSLAVIIRRRLKHQR